MIAVVQRVRRAEVRVPKGSHHTGTGGGLMILVGVAVGDMEREAEILARKCANMRIFEDEYGKMNLSVRDAFDKPEVLVVSQFTLLGDMATGRRPSFAKAAPPEEAAGLYEHFCRVLEGEGVSVKKGVFGARMEVELVNDGPVTLIVNCPAG